MEHLFLCLKLEQVQMGQWKLRCAQPADAETHKWGFSPGGLGGWETEPDHETRVMGGKTGAGPRSVHLFARGDNRQGCCASLHRLYAAQF